MGTICARTGAIVREYADTIHFFGGPENWESWQKVCWVFDCNEARFTDLKAGLAMARKEFQQDSAAITQGETELV